MVPALLALATAACGAPGDRAPGKGDPLPPVRLVGLEGDTTRLDEYRGRALLINVWASWCAPCRAELPLLAAYYRSLDTTRVGFVAISADAERTAAVEFIRPFDLPFPWFHVGPGAQDVFGFVGLPYTLIVDARGLIVERIYGFGSLEAWEHLQRTLEAEIPDLAPATAPAARETSPATPPAVPELP